ncbi:Cilia- and flagella-associated protein 70 [Chytridiales sp. JEL 0842]|nr:Cilia- and flagella-associated protein 70 [Chytridiales sp. JEL 0842]
MSDVAANKQGTAKGNVAMAMKGANNNGKAPANPAGPPQQSATTTSAPADDSTATSQDNAASASADGTSSNSGTVTLSIKVNGARNIRGAKGEHVNSFVRVQFADFDYKDSHVALDNSNPEYHFVYEQTFHIDENLIDIFANKKVSLTLIESLPKEKTQVLGHAECFLGSTFLKYQHRDPDSANPDQQLPPPPTNFKSSLPISYVNPKLLPSSKAAATVDASGGEGSNLPELNVDVSISNLLIPMDVIEAGNFVTIKLDDAFPVPDEWTLKEGTEKDLSSNIYQYTISFMVPASTSLERQITIAGGVLAQSEVPNQSDASAFGSQPIFVNKSHSDTTGTSQTSDSHHHTTNTEPTNSRNDAASVPQTPGAASDKNGGGVSADASAVQSFKKVTWNGTHTIWFPPEAIVRMREKILSKQPLELEFNREMQPKYSHLSDPTPGKYKGKATVDIACLMYPRVMGLRGRFTLDIHDPPSTPSTEVDQPGKSKKPSKEDDGNLYKSLGTHFGMELLLEKPLLDKKKLQPITKVVTDFIPRRVIPAHMIFEKRSQRADEEYRIQIQDIVRNLVKEYQACLQMGAPPLHEESQGGDLESLVNSKSAEEAEKKKKKFLYQLNQNGAYFSFKEQLKSAVVEVVRERFQKKSPFISKAELQLFISELYVYLVDQMHIGINNMFRNKEMAFVDPTISRTADFSLLKAFADQAELDYNVAIAATYHKERIAKYEDSMQACLLAYGAVCCVHEKYEESRVILATAIDLQPKYVLSQTIMGLYYEAVSEEYEAEKLLGEAARLHKLSTPPDSPSLFLSAAIFLIQINAGLLAERALSHELLQTGPSVIPYLQLCQLEIQRGNFDRAQDHIKEALQVRQDDPNAWACLAHLQHRQKNYAEAKVSYETVLSLPYEPNNTPLIYTRLGSIYLGSISTVANGHIFRAGKANLPAIEHERHIQDTNFAKMAKSMFLRACEAHASAQSWLGVGKACIALGEYDEAEDALAEANVLNNRDSEVWSFLALLCLIQDRQFEANQSISQAIRLGINDPEILRLVGSSFMDCSQPAPAIECFRMALELDPNHVETQALFMKAMSQHSKDFLASKGGQSVEGGVDTEPFVDISEGVRV